MNTKNFLFITCLCFLMTACGYGREDDKEASRQQDLRGLNQEMEQSLARIDSLKTELSQRQEMEEGTEPAAEDRFSVMRAKLRRAETSYMEWRDAVVYEPTDMDHDERMQYFNQEEQRAEAVRHEMESAIQYVERELQ